MEAALNDVNTLLATCSKPYWIAGGWALDLFLGKQSRAHEDVDVMILKSDEHVWRQHLNEYEIWQALGDQGLSENPIKIDEELNNKCTSLWVRKNSNSPWFFELLLSPSTNDEWIFRRNPEIRLPIKDIGLSVLQNKYQEGRTSSLRAEIVLLFKAKNTEEKDNIDFENVFPKLDSNAKIWFMESLKKTHPGHDWLKYE